MSQITLAKEIANDRTDVRLSAWASYEASAIASIQAHFPDLSGAEIEAVFGPAIMHFMVGLYYESNDVDEIHLSSAKHHFQKYDALLQDFHPSPTHYDQYIAEATASIQARFPDLTTVATVFAGAIVSYCISRFYEKNGVGDRAAKASYFMGLCNNDIAGYQPTSSDLTQYEAEAKASLENRFPDIAATEIPVLFASAIKNYALGRFFGKNGNDSDTTKSSYYMGKFESEVAAFQPKESEYSIFIAMAQEDLLSRRPYLTLDDIPRYEEALKYYAQAKFWERNGGDAKRKESRLFYQKYREMT